MRHTATFAAVTLTIAAVAFLGASVIVTQSAKVHTITLTAPVIGTAKAEPVAVTATEQLVTDESWTRWPTLVY